MKLSRKLLLAAVVVAGLAVGAAHFLRAEAPEAAHPGEDITDLSAVYDEVREEIAAADKRWEENKRALVYTRDLSGRRMAAVIVDGLPDRSLTTRLLDVFARHKVPAVFFVEGQNAAAQPETIRAIASSRQEIGNFTYVGTPKLHEMERDEVLGQVIRTQKVLETLTGRRASLFRAPRLKLNDTILRAVYAADAGDAVQTDVYLERGAVPSAAEADGFVAGLRPGSIIAVQAGEPVDLIEPQETKSDERPAIDKKPSIKELPSLPRKRLTLADELEHLLTALEKQGYEIVPLREMRRIDYVPQSTGKETPNG